MHEIGVVRAMVKTVTDYAAANQIDEISEIVADCGELSLVIPEYRYVLSHLRTFCPWFLAGTYGNPVLLCKDGHAPVRRPGVLEEPGAAVFSNGYRYHGYPCQIFPFLHA